MEDKEVSTLEMLEKMIPTNDTQSLTLLVSDLLNTPTDIQAKVLSVLIMHGIGLRWIDRVKVFLVRKFVGVSAIAALEQSLASNSQVRDPLWNVTLETVKRSLFTRSEMLFFYQLLISLGYSPGENITEHYRIKTQWQK